EHSRKGVELFKRSQWLQTRYDRNMNTGIPALLYKIKILLVIKKHLGNHIIGPCIHFGFQVSDIHFHIGRFKMLFRITCYTYTKIGTETISNIIFQINTIVKVYHLL